MGIREPQDTARYPGTLDTQERREAIPCECCSIRRRIQGSTSVEISSAKQSDRKGSTTLLRGPVCRRRRVGLWIRSGVPPHLYLERWDAAVLQRLGLSAEDPGRRADVYLRIPFN